MKKFFFPRRHSFCSAQAATFTLLKSDAANQGQSASLGESTQPGATWRRHQAKGMHMAQQRAERRGLEIEDDAQHSCGVRIFQIVHLVVVLVWSTEV